MISIKRAFVERIAAIGVGVMLFHTSALYFSFDDASVDSDRAHHLQRFALALKLFPAVPL